MTLKKIDHIGVAVLDLKKAVATYEMLGFKVSSYHDVPNMKVKAAFLPIGDTRFEFLEPTSDDSVIAKYIQKRGEGIHHVCLAVNDVVIAQKDLAAKGFKFVYDAPQDGADNALVTFMHPKSTNGILLELSQKRS